jgi:hypothetical protein
MSGHEVADGDGDPQERQGGEGARKEAEPDGVADFGAAAAREMWAGEV